MLIELSDALRNFLWCRGYWDERILLNEWAYQAAQSLFFWRDAGWAAYSVAWIYINRAETDRAVIWADRAAEAMARGGDRHDQSVAKHLRGRIAYDQRNFIEAKRLYTEVLAIYREMNEETDEAIVLNDLGVVVVELQDDKQAQDYYTQALKIHEKRGETVYQPAIFGNLGDLSLKCGDLIEARKNYDYQLNLAKKINRQDLVTNAQVGLACVLEQQGAYREALNLGEEAQKTSLRLRQRNLKKVNQLIARLRKKLSL
jgi:tetratricopeptide (TPR) repeat protein